MKLSSYTCEIKNRQLADKKTHLNLNESGQGQSCDVGMHCMHLHLRACIVSALPCRWGPRRRRTPPPPSCSKVPSPPGSGSHGAAALDPRLCLSIRGRRRRIRSGGAPPPRDPETPGRGLQRRMASLWRHGGWWSRASPGWHRSRRRKAPPGRRGGSPASPDGSRREAGSRQIGEQTGVHLRTAAAARRGGAGLRRDGAREAPPHQSVDGGRWIREKLKTAPMIYYGAGNLLGNKNQRRTVHAEEGEKPDGKERSARVRSAGGSGMG